MAGLIPGGCALPLVRSCSHSFYCNASSRAEFRAGGSSRINENPVNSPQVISRRAGRPGRVEPQPPRRSVENRRWPTANQVGQGCQSCQGIARISEATNGSEGVAKPEWVVDLRPGLHLIGNG